MIATASQHSCRTPLQIAAMEGRPDEVEQLLDAGTDVDEQDQSGDGSTALILAAERGHVTVVRLLLQRSADIKKCKIDKWRALHIAAYNGHAPVVKMLIEAGDDINWPDCDQSTPLHVATLYGYTEVIQCLLDSTAGPAMEDCMGRMPLHLACRDGHRNAVDLFLKTPQATRLIGHPDKAKMTPLHTAVMQGHAAIVQLLIDKGADPDAKNAANLTPIELAARSGHVECLKCLLPLLKNSTKVTLGGVLCLAAEFGHVDCCVEMLLRRNGTLLADARSALLSLPQSESVQRLKSQLETPTVTDDAADEMKRPDQFSMDSLAKALEEAGFAEDRMRCLHVRAEVQQTILRRQVADSTDWSDCEAHLVGSYCDGCGNSVECADGSTDLQSDIDVLLLSKSQKPIHIESYCTCSAVPSSEKVKYDDGHVIISGVASNPTKYYGPSHLKPSMDMVAAQYCCCYPTIALLKTAQYFPKHILHKLEMEVARQMSSCHVVSAAAPDKRGQQKRISTAFLEIIVMKSLTTAQCCFFVTLKYLVKRVISAVSPGLKTYHVKSLLFQALDATPPDQWRRDQDLQSMLVTALQWLEKALRAVQSGDLRLMRHFFLPDAALYLKDSSCPTAIADSTRSTIKNLDIELSKFVSLLRPQHVDKRIVYHPLLHLPLNGCRLELLTKDESDNLSALSVRAYNAMIAVTKCMECLSTESSSAFAVSFEEVNELIDAYIGDFAIAAKVSLKALLLMRMNQRDQAHQELLHLLTNSKRSDFTSSGILTPADCQNAAAMSQKLLQGRNYFARFCCRLDDGYQLDTEALALTDFNCKVFPAQLPNHIHSFYVNFNALAIYLMVATLSPDQCCSADIIEIAMQLAEDPDADLQEIFLALKLGQDADRLVGIAHRHRSVIGREPELQAAMQDRLSQDIPFKEASIARTFSQMLP